MPNKIFKKILLTGGGTMGSVSPLLAVYGEALGRGRNWEWFWVGTKRGIEKNIIEEKGISYEWIPSAKLRRYFSLRTALEPFVLLVSFLRSLLIIFTIKPDVVIGAGSFVSVPVIWAAWVMRKKIIIHQQDIRPTLSNLMTAWCADVITISFIKSKSDFPGNRTVFVGNPLNKKIESASVDSGKRFLNFNNNKNIILILGGSSGAFGLNKWVWSNIDILLNKGNVVHITGFGNMNQQVKKENYRQFEYIKDKVYDILKVADLVISRSGISTLSELSYLKKVCLLVPMPQTHQEDNAFYYSDKGAAMVLRQDQLKNKGISRVEKLLTDSGLRENLIENIGQITKADARERFFSLLDETIN